uniref:NADH-ubiquinone oxidoreductase chain 4 n=1 Tax=Glyptonotus cf. antarcticus FK-2009 TaxID=692432 RepID=E3SX93_9CRUS|nr:NADH dehydrogenase subunit 4 [Glyptonotus cf. antarcticus FK-2009]
MMTLLFSSLFLGACVLNWLSLMIAFIFCFMVSILLFKHNVDVFIVGVNMTLDTLSLSLISLSIWISMLMLQASWQISQTQKFTRFFMLMIVILLNLLTWTFSTSDLIQFYVMFECSLIPTFILILGWGYQPERIQAGVYMLLYTLFASLPLLLSLLLWNVWDCSSNMIMASGAYQMSPAVSTWGLASLFAFLVKLPLYIVHLWLPKAHVEAPVAGSMMLAGVLLKLGGYGLIRIAPKLNLSLFNLNGILIIWAIVGGMIASLICVSQIDVKFLIALSSVAHMSMVLGGVMTFSSWGVNGAIFIMMGHGFCSSGLFCIANMSYEQIGSRCLMLLKGLQTMMPSLTLWWFLFAAANMAAPPSLNLMGEMNSIIALVSWSKSLSFPLAWLVFFAAVYSLYLYSISQHGGASSFLFSVTPSTPREFLTLSLHWLPLNLIILNPILFQLIVC